MDRKTSDDLVQVKTLIAASEPAMERYSVRMTAYHARMARRVGAGNMSEGIRVMMENFASHSPLCKKP